MSLDLLQVINDTNRRGAQTFAVDLQTVLARQGVRVETAALYPGELDRRFEVPVLGSRRLGVKTLWALRRVAARARIVAGHGAGTLPALALATARGTTPFVYRNIGDPLYWANTAARRARVRAFLSRAAAVVALWPGSAKVLVSEFRVQPARVRVIPNGVPAERCPVITAERRARARERMTLPGQAAVLCFVGSMTPEKSLGTAIEALAALPEAQLMIVGDGPERPRLEALAASRAPGRARFFGHLSDPTPVLAAADAVVLPSLSEGLPGVLIEAGLSGLPAVASAVGGIAEIVRDGITGALVPPADPRALAEGLRRVLADASALGASARRHCLERFEIQVVASAWRRLMEEVPRAA